MWTRVREYLGGDADVDGLVVTVPAHFDHRQRRETLEAIRQAGARARKTRVCNEPTAAAVAYSERAKISSGERVIVFDLGGGTLDVTCVQAIGGREYEILGSQGSGELGGADIDQRILSRAIDHCKRHTKRNLRSDKSALAGVRVACEQAKKALSVSCKTTLSVGCDVPTMTISRDDVESWIRPELTKCAETLYALLDLIDKEPGEINRVLLVGGSSRVPAVRNLVQKVFPDVPLHADINVDECVAMGASVLARELEEASSEEPCVRDVLPKAVGIKTGDNVMHVMVEANSSLPTEAFLDLYPQHEGQRCADICVYQGDSKRTDDNTYLGFVRLKNLGVGRPRVRLQIHVTTDGTVEIDAKDDHGSRVVGKVNL